MKRNHKIIAGVCTFVLTALFAENFLREKSDEDTLVLNHPLKQEQPIREVVMAEPIVMGEASFSQSENSPEKLQREKIRKYKVNNQIIVSMTEEGKSLNLQNPSEIEKAVSQAAGVPVKFVSRLFKGKFTVEFAFKDVAVEEPSAKQLEENPFARDRAAMDRVLLNLSESDLFKVEENRIVWPLSAPNDAEFQKQWHLFEQFGMRASLAWTTSTGNGRLNAPNPNILPVAVIDTGYTDHPDLLQVQGYDFISDKDRAGDGSAEDSDARDLGDFVTQEESQNSSSKFFGCPVSSSSWHGTHVAGIAAALSNNGAGVTGINWNTPVRSVRALGKCGGSLSDVLRAIRWGAGLEVDGVPTAQSKASVVNLSLGFSAGTCPSSLQDVIDELLEQNVPVVAAAGNSASDVRNVSPANCSGVISVAASDRQGDLAYYSNKGSVTISAPGGGFLPSRDINGLIFSTYNAGSTTPGAPAYAFAQGTSMAAPMVAGAIALVKSVDPSLSVSQLTTLVTRSANSFPEGSSCKTNGGCGAGIIDLESMLARYTEVKPNLVVTRQLNPLAMFDQIPSSYATVVNNVGEFTVNVKDVPLDLMAQVQGRPETKTLLKRVFLPDLNIRPGGRNAFRIEEITVALAPSSVPYEIWTEFNAPVDSTGKRVVEEQRYEDNISQRSDVRVFDSQFKIVGVTRTNQAPSTFQYAIVHQSGDRLTERLLQGREWSAQWTLPDTDYTENGSGLRKRITFNSALEDQVTATLAHVSGFTQTINVPVSVIEADPWMVGLVTRPDTSNTAQRVPLIVTFRPELQRGHPNDQMDTFEWEVKHTNNSGVETIRSNRTNFRATLTEPGQYEIKGVLKTTMGYTVTEQQTLNVNPNTPPNCQLSQSQDSERNWFLLNADCVDPDAIRRPVLSYTIRSSLNPQAEPIVRFANNARPLRLQYDPANQGETFFIEFVCKDDSGATYRANFEISH